jgi:hypothetical protein
MNKGKPWLCVLVLESFTFGQIETEYFQEGIVREDVNGHLAYTESVRNGCGQFAIEDTYIDL